ncbi:transcriptional regulator GcvA [Azoarcus communis]|uniref:LysR family transcriptional regulator n=1 Tax=Parazoarcus communis SWub3 = DSM 12120 TaxID=1121029 RepID=A0A323UWM1_9RHOO|nr:LysR family transcriptional regulator [Parazoarcus communis]NMG48325.1 transcriptional regulator GcvA [Parazoarcus communis]NMG71399.1 transcriptional regulator GcvA [Parazoarcus communis SWub3 = DSM 12120]PZA15626.1 LysR family transcriptional regulator [Azoarcus communis] [Parazoarcus communis SWub3 = DSM 12120]
MRKKIPSTAALMAFEAAARHESFTRAADELALTQSAICRQIAGLEDFLGVALFRRTRRGVQLSEAGMRYARQITPRLDAIERDTLAVMAQHGSGSTIELAVVPTFATRWLMPRLADFRSRHPEVQINMSTQTRPFLFDQTEFDAAIYFGEAGWPGTEAHFLMREFPVPVCSPALPGAQAGLPPEAIARLPLLQQTTRPYAWRQWFEAAGVSAPQDMAGMRLELFSMLAQAAIERMGVALIPPFLIEQELQAGRLMIPCERSLASQRAYYLIMPEHKAERPELSAFRSWLIETAAAPA